MSDDMNVNDTSAHDQCKKKLFNSFVFFLLKNISRCQNIFLMILKFAENIIHI